MTPGLLASRSTRIGSTGYGTFRDRGAGDAMQRHKGARQVGVAVNAAPKFFDRQVFLAGIEHDVGPGGGFEPQLSDQFFSRFRRANFARIPMRIFCGAGNCLGSGVADHNRCGPQSVSPDLEFNLLQLSGICRREPHSKKREAPHRPDQPHSEFLIACRPNNNQHTGGINP